jgi:hypothetical protein
MKDMGLSIDDAQKEWAELMNDIAGNNAVEAINTIDNRLDEVANEQ